MSRKFICSKEHVAENSFSMQEPAPHNLICYWHSLNSERQESFLFLLVLSVSVAITSKTMQNFLKWRRGRREKKRQRGRGMGREGGKEWEEKKKRKKEVNKEGKKNVFKGICSSNPEAMTPSI